MYESKISGTYYYSAICIKNKIFTSKNVKKFSFLSENKFDNIKKTSVFAFYHKYILAVLFFLITIKNISYNIEEQKKTGGIPMQSKLPILRKFLQEASFLDEVVFSTVFNTREAMQGLLQKMLGNENLKVFTVFRINNAELDKCFEHRVLVATQNDHISLYVVSLMPQQYDYNEYFCKMKEQLTGSILNYSYGNKSCVNYLAFTHLDDESISCQNIELDETTHAYLINLSYKDDENEIGKIIYDLPLNNPEDMKSEFIKELAQKCKSDFGFFVLSKYFTESKKFTLLAQAVELFNEGKTIAEIVEKTELKESDVKRLRALIPDLPEEIIEDPENNPTVEDNEKEELLEVPVIEDTVSEDEVLNPQNPQQNQKPNKKKKHFAKRR
jgi:hypothetical protein